MHDWPVPLEYANDHGIDRGIKIRVRENNMGRLSSQLQGYRDQPFRRSLRDIPSARGASGETNHSNSAVVYERLSDLGSSRQDVQDTRRDAGFEGHSAQFDRARRGDFGWLKHNRISGSQDGRDF